MFAEIASEMSLRRRNIGHSVSIASFEYVCRLLPAFSVSGFAASMGRLEAELGAGEEDGLEEAGSTGSLPAGEFCRRAYADPLWLFHSKAALSFVENSFPAAAAEVLGEVASSP